MKCVYTMALAVMLTAHLGAAQKITPDALVDKPDEWFTSDEGKRLVDNIITWQNPWGGWLKQYDVSTPRPEKLPEQPEVKGIPKVTGDNWTSVSTFDNGGTFTELRILGRAVRVTGKPEYRAAFDKGLGFVFDAQYANGGWPQRFPLHDDYGRFITFNDNAMLGVLGLLNDIAAGKPDFAFLPDSTRAQAKTAADRGVDCILACQIKANGKLTAWCQQHDDATLAPAHARAYELPSICTFESAFIVEYLMEIPNPDDRVKTAIESAVAWFESTKILGKKYERINDPKLEYGVDRVLKDDPTAPPIWARFYDIETNKPMFSDRDGKKRWNFEEVGAERRARYSWFNTSPGRVLKKYPEWKEKVGK